MSGLKKSFDKKDEFLFLIDNSKDNTLEVLEREMGDWKYQSFFTTTDAYEIYCNNWLLRRSTNFTTILFQDDIISDDPLIKKKIFNIFDKVPAYERGLMGGRSGFHLKKTGFPEKPFDRVSSWEHKDEQYEKRLKEGEFDFRPFLNRGPLVFTNDLIERVGYLDDAFYPQWGDDLDYCARCEFEHGLKNVVFQCNVISNLGWGSMRNKKSPLFTNFGSGFMKRNWDLFIKRWGEFLE